MIQMKKQTNNTPIPMELTHASIVSDLHHHSTLLKFATADLHEPEKAVAAPAFIWAPYPPNSSMMWHWLYEAILRFQPPSALVVMRNTCF